MPDIGLIGGITGSVVGVGGLVVSLWKVRNDRTSGVSSSAREQRRDTVADRDSLIDQFQEALASEREQRRHQAAEFEIRLSKVEMSLRVEREYTEMLVEHIWTGNPPPPPKRFEQA